MLSASVSGEAPLTDHPASDSWEPAWSPDGSKIAFRSSRDGNDNVYVMNADGSGAAALTDDPANDREPAWQTLPSADLALGIAASPDQAKKSRPLTYTITVANTGPSNAQGIVVTDALPPETRFVSAAPSKGSCVTPPPGATGTVTCALGFLLNTQSATAQIVVKVIVRKGTVSNTASVASNTPDPYMANNSATIAAPVR